MRFLTLGTEPQTYRRACQHLHHTPATVLPARTCCALLLPPLDLDLPALLRQLRLLLQLRANPGSLADQPAGRQIACASPAAHSISVNWTGRSSWPRDRRFVTFVFALFGSADRAIRAIWHPRDSTREACRCVVSLVTDTSERFRDDGTPARAEALRDCLMPTRMTQRARRGGSKVAPGAVHELQREERAASSSKA